MPPTVLQSMCSGGGRICWHTKLLGVSARQQYVADPTESRQEGQVLQTLAPVHCSDGVSYPYTYA